MNSATGSVRRTSDEPELSRVPKQEIVSAAAVEASIRKMAVEIKAAMGERFPLLLSVMGGAAVFTGMLLPHLDFPLEFDYVHLTRYRNTTQGGEMHWRVAPAESVKDRELSVPTQFSRALAELGIELILAGSPQAKGRIERLWGTLQDRWVKELRLADVKTIALSMAMIAKRPQERADA